MTRKNTHVPILKAGHDLALLVQEIMRGAPLSSSKSELMTRLADIGDARSDADWYCPKALDADRVTQALEKQVRSMWQATRGLTDQQITDHPDLTDLAGPCRMVKRRWREWLRSHEASAPENQPDALLRARTRFTEKTAHHPTGEV